jgi:CDP-glucose 4,6-dehydratase
VPVRELVDRIIHSMGSELEPEVRNEAKHEIKHQYLSAEKARRVLGWRPLFTLDEGLSRTIAWYDDFLRQEAP